METTSSAKKVLNIIGRIFSWIIIAFAVFMMIFTVISVTTVNKQDRSLFGFRPFIVLSNSMSPDYFDAGDLIFSKKVNTDNIEVGDVITFQAPGGGSNYEMGDIITHKISLIEIKTVSATSLPTVLTQATRTALLFPKTLFWVST